MAKGKIQSKTAKTAKPAKSTSPLKKLVGQVMKAVKGVAPPAAKTASAKKPIGKAAAPKSAPKAATVKGGKGATAAIVATVQTTEVLVTSTVTADLLQKNLQTNSQGEAVCREAACESMAVVGGYCRLHYIKNWKKIKRKESVLKERKLNRYIEELVAKYPDKYIEAIRHDLANDKDFNKVVRDLELDEGAEELESDQESADTLIEGIRRDIDDEDDLY